MKAAMAVLVPGCQRISVTQPVQMGDSQVTFVSVVPGDGKPDIPLHRHECAAVMVIRRGTARVHNEIGELTDLVQKDDVVAKGPNQPHGFGEMSDDFAFMSISENEGIFNDDITVRDMEFVPA